MEIISKEQMARRKREIEDDLLNFLNESKSEFTLDHIKDAIFNEDGTDSFTDIVAMFDIGWGADGLENIIDTIEDAWNYFPHKALKGKSPQESILEANEKPELSATMQITRKQYDDLLRAVYLADWMANAICSGDIEEDAGITDAKNLIYSLAKQMGYDEYVTHDEETGGLYSTWDLDDSPSVRLLIKRYDDHTFWEELADRLGERDFFKTYSKSEIQKMDNEERFKEQMKCQIHWERELEKHGIDRLSKSDVKNKKK